MMKLRISPFDALVFGAILSAGMLGLWLLSWLLGGSNIVVTNRPAPDVIDGPVSALSGLPCESAQRRPVAVMIASDEEARPLSGISQADMVFEMPVTPNGITRMMAVFQCADPKEIGSIRSARKDFIPLAQGIDAILAHWGGEKDALDMLNDGVMDNVDALKYEGSTFYRKSAVPRPHNGFTNLTLIDERAGVLGYRATTSLDGYTRTDTAAGRSLGSISDTVRVEWPQGMDITFTYDGASNTYLRSRGGEPEIDISTDRQAHASVVIVMQTEATFMHDQYISVETLGNGVATIWQNGQRVNALWKKERAEDMLQFTDSKGSAIALERGVVWILIDAPLPTP